MSFQLDTVKILELHKNRRAVLHRGSQDPGQVGRFTECTFIEFWNEGLPFSPRSVPLESSSVVTTPCTVRVPRTGDLLTTWVVEGSRLSHDWPVVDSKTHLSPPGYRRSPVRLSSLSPVTVPTPTSRPFRVWAPVSGKGLELNSDFTGAPD